MTPFPRPAAWRRPALPPDARAALDLGDERVLAWSGLVAGGWAVATPGALHLLLPSGTRVTHPWTDVDHVAWHAESGMLAVWWVGTRLPTGLELLDATSLPEVVHERVQSSVVLARDVVLQGGRTVWVALRKADDGTLTTQTVPARGVRMSDPQVAALVSRAVAALRDEAGLPPDG